MNESTTPWWDSRGKLQYGAGADPAQRIEYLLTTGKKPWQKKLFQNEGRSVDASSRLNYLRYPMELLNTPNHMSAMVFEIFDTNPTHLNTARTKLGKLSESTIKKLNNLVDDNKKQTSYINQLRSSNPSGRPGGEGRGAVAKRGDGSSVLLTPILDANGGVKEYQISDLQTGEISRVATIEEAGIPTEYNQGVSDAKEMLTTLVDIGAGAGGLYADVAQTILWGEQPNPVVKEYYMDKIARSKPNDFGGYINDSFVEEATGFGGGTKDVGARIYLYLPQNIESEYGFEYDDTNMSALDITRLAKVVSETGNKDLAAVVGRKLAMSNVKAVEGLAKEIPVLGNSIDDGLFSKALEAQSRQIVNPMAMHLFKEVKRRSFTFTYTFLPKSNEEMLNCYRIIHLFKYYAHPATSGHGRFLDYPAEFNIKFYQKNNENNDIISGYLPYIFKCALTGIKVTYGEDSVMSTFMPDPAGAPPTKIVLELQFSELEILTRDRFGSSEWMPGINLPQP